MTFNIKSILEFLNPAAENSGPTAIIGLGNPGKKYQDTRHNIGFMAIDKLIKSWNIQESFQLRKKKCEHLKTSFHRKNIILIKPLTFMNLSGQAVQWAQANYRLRIENMIVIYDDYDLPLGQIRIRKKGSGGSHNGMNSIVERIGENFPRIRIGIHGNGNEAKLHDYVLGKFEENEQIKVQEALDIIPDILQTILFDGIDRAMNRFN